MLLPCNGACAHTWFGWKVVREEGGGNSPAFLVHHLILINTSFVFVYIFACVAIPHCGIWLKFLISHINTHIYINLLKHAHSGFRDLQAHTHHVCNDIMCTLIFSLKTHWLKLPKMRRTEIVAWWGVLKNFQNEKAIQSLRATGSDGVYLVTFVSFVVVYLHWKSTYISLVFDFEYNGRVTSRTNGKQ